MTKERQSGPDGAAAPPKGGSQTLRRRAEDLFREKTARKRETLEALSPEETRQILHELQVHQIELEMQNEELRRTQEELEASRARYFDLYDLAPVGYVTLNEQGLILEINLTAATLLKTSRNALVKQRLTQFILPEDQNIYSLHRKQLFETCKPRVCELRLMNQDGTSFWARLNSVIDQDAATKILVWRITISDITEHLRAEKEKIKQLSQKLEAWMMIAARLAHELKNPLTVITSCTQFCIEEGIPAPLRKNLEIIRRNALSANAILKNLVNLAFTSDLEFGPVGLNDVILEMWDMIKVIAPDKKISFTRKIDPHLPVIEGDREKLKQVFNNLFLNAIQAVADPGNIIVETRHLNSENRIEVVIIDDGPGITKEQLSNIFTPFYSTKKEGMGMGLIICQSIVHWHKGSIAVDSEGNQGARFSVRLPLHQDIKD